jgi:hypothetical protein
MEKHEEGSDNKAERILKQFQGKFRFISYTLHQIRQFEQKGKASNVSWCVENLAPKF